MKTINELLKEYIVDGQTGEREIGRYWASDIYPIMKGYLTPEKFFSPQEPDLTGCKMMITGEAFEEKLEQVFRKLNVDFEYQLKKEIVINDEIVLVVRPDFVFPEFIIETKFPFRAVDDVIPERYVYQLECYYRAFYKKVFLGVLSIPFNVRLIEYTPSKWRWEKTKNALLQFHNRLKDYNKGRTKLS